VRVIIAGFGFLGHKIAEKLLEAEYEVTVIRRNFSQPTPNESRIRFARCDLVTGEPDLETKKFDLAVFCLAPEQRDLVRYQEVYCKAQSNFLKAVRPAHYIYISSTAVYGDVAASYSENDSSPHSDRAAILLDAENIARAQSHATVLRLAGLYSAERPIYGKSTTMYVQDKLVHFIHRDDAARAVAHSAFQALQGTYNVHDGNPQLRSAIMQALSLPHAQTSVVPQRQISAEKFYATGFRPDHIDYFHGIGLLG
jgi:nucleoside-diphosphate-sugar epimerase